MILTYSDIKSFLDANINTNGINAITGALHNIAETYLLEQFNGLPYDSTRTYEAGKNTVIYLGETYICKTTISTPEAWNSAKWQKITGIMNANTKALTGGVDNDVDFNIAFASTDYVVIPRCYDADGNVDFIISAETVSKFTIKPVADCTCKYIAIQYF